MPFTRRVVIASFAVLPALRGARAQSDDPRMAERGIGNAEAKVTVQEYFSLTCTHCAAFQKETFPQVRQQLIDTGRIRYVWRDFPLDQLALMAAMVARALPAAQYEPFITALLTSQDRWAFNRSANPTDELAKFAALAGMSRATFEATIKDEKLRQAILTVQDAGEKKYSVNSTPTFVMNGKAVPGEMSYDAFLKAVEAAPAA